MNLLRTFVIASLVFAASLTSASAQERYEQMILTYSPVNRILAVSTDTGEYREETATKTESKHGLDLTPALTKVKQLSSEGWELYQNSVLPQMGLLLFHFRRPLK